MTTPPTPEPAAVTVRTCELFGDDYHPGTQRTCTLTFPLAPVLAAAEHAAAADHHAPNSPTSKATPSLWWVNDDGTYLISNGINPTRTPGDNPPTPFAHADGWGPGTDASPLLGGDDFCESLDLTTPDLHNGHSLLTLLRHAHTHGATRFHLNATFDDMRMQLTFRTD
ncbi:DUF3085 domain-containing protein [Streptomyces sp. NPDC001941]|uniref:DUF3085 domain-containing protein n=1 Tax=Streptomyces sp. NPDC001941 TaxID=3154659 RepID=UPI00331A8A0C